MKLLYNAESGPQAAHVTPCFVENYDVLVVGAGTAGAIAAIRAARGGMRVCAVDRLSFPGGMLTGAVFGYYYGAKGGLYEEIDTRARALQENAEAFFPSQGIQRLARMQVLEEMFAEEGVYTRYETFVLGVFVEGRRIAGVRCVSHGRVEDLSCAFAIDGTSEGYLCAMAGCAASLGRACDGRTQPFSLVSLSCAAGGGPTRHSNSDFGYVDTCSCEAISRTVLSRAGEIRLGEGLPLGMASLVGAREGRHIRGEACVRWQDFVEQAPIDRPVTYSISNMDDHGKDMALESPLHADWMVGMSLWGATVRLQVPMGALIPVEYDNLCVAGRHLCMDHDCSAQLRMNRDIQRVGEAAGAIAAEAVRAGVPAKDAPYEKILASLLSTGCMEPLAGCDVWDTKPLGGAVDYPQSDEDMRALLASDKPGLGMLYAIRARKTGLLRAWLEEAGEWLSFNAACALALMDDASGAEILLRDLHARDRRMPATSRKFNMPRGVTALYCLGRLAHPACEAECLRIWREKDALLQEAVGPDEFFARPEDTQFAYLSHAARALLNLADRYPERRASIEAFLLDHAFRPDFRVSYSLKEGRNLPWDATADLQNYIRWRIQNR